MAFPHYERKILLATPGIGPGVIQRLEEAGFDSFSSLHARGLDKAIAIICKQVGSQAWLNRRRSLVRALETATHKEALASIALRDTCGVAAEVDEAGDLGMARNVQERPAAMFAFNLKD